MKIPFHTHPQQTIFSTKQITNKVFVESVGESLGELEMKIFTNRINRTKRIERKRETYWVLIF